jgi:hypothetical protein
MEMAVIERRFHVFDDRLHDFAKAIAPRQRGHENCMASDIFTFGFVMHVVRVVFSL